MGTFILAHDVLAVKDFRTRTWTLKPHPLSPLLTCSGPQPGPSSFLLTLRSTCIPVCLPFNLQDALWYGQQCYLHFVDEEGN